jgi:hypothetical protein
MDDQSVDEPVANSHGNSVGDYGLTEDRVRHILSMVKKKANIALSGRSGNHFRVHPPTEFLEHATITNESNIYDKMKETVWWVRWYDDQYDQLRFIEFLVFVHQVIQAKRAFDEASKTVLNHPAVQKGSKHAGGWQPKKVRGRKPKKREGTIGVKVEGGFAPAELSKDEMIRALFSKTTFEPTTRPGIAIN